MTTLKPPSRAETVAGSEITQGILQVGPQVLAAVALASPLSPLILAPLLPILTGTIASTLFSQRIEAAVDDINKRIKTFAEENAQAFKQLSEAQFKLINESVMTLLQTMDDEKIGYLKQIVSGALRSQDIVPQEAAMLSRVLRDITGEEVRFLVDNYQYKRILIGIPEADKTPPAHHLWIIPNTDEALIVRGLASLGMLSGVDTIFDYKDVDCFSKTASKLLALLGTNRDV